jgi:hypothetical protein
LRNRSEDIQLGEGFDAGTTIEELAAVRSARLERLGKVPDASDL